ncbi:MAG: superoxide dismutase [Ni] [Desulfobacterales bacterium]|jgi:nickel superoxide dismutase
MKKPIFIFLTGLLPFLFFLSNADAHCEIPCGIYDDELRTKLIAEHATTIEKSMKQIMELSKANSVDYNQLSRWVSNKEAHATKIQKIISQYFMTQRIKPGQKKYVEKLTALHKMLIAAMKCKQTTDFSHVDALRSHLKNFEVLYFGQSNN